MIQTYYYRTNGPLPRGALHAETDETALFLAKDWFGDDLQQLFRCADDDVDGWKPFVVIYDKNKEQ